MTDPRWRMVPYPSFIINDVFVTSLLLLKNFKALTYSMILIMLSFCGEKRGFKSVHCLLVFTGAPKAT